MNPHLFVYGSLVAAAAHPKGARLRQEALFLGPATIAGRLYRVTWFPAILPAEGQATGSTASFTGWLIRSARWFGSIPTRASRQADRVRRLPISTSGPSGQ